MSVHRQLKSFLVQDKNYLFYIVNIIGADVLPSATMILAKLNRDDSVSLHQQRKTMRWNFNQGKIFLYVMTSASAS